MHAYSTCMHMMHAFYETMHSVHAVVSVVSHKSIMCMLWFSNDLFNNHLKIPLSCNGEHQNKFFVPGFKLQIFLPGKLGLNRFWWKKKCCWDTFHVKKAKVLRYDRTRYPGGGSCASACKVTHLMRTIPPKQLKTFLDGFDSLLRKAMERILGHDLNDQQ